MDETQIMGHDTQEPAEAGTTVTCPACGAVVPAEAETCPECSASLPAEKPGAGDQEAQETLPEMDPNCNQATMTQRVQDGTTRVHLANALVPTTGAGLFDVVAITPGMGNGILFPAETLQRSVQSGLWDNAPMFVDHDWGLNRSLRDLGAVFCHSTWNNGVRGQLRPTGPAGPLVEAIAREWLHDKALGLPVPNIGLSADLLFRGTDLPNGGQQVDDIVRVLSLDLVIDPARGGLIERALNSLNIHRPRNGETMEPIVSTQAPAPAPIVPASAPATPPAAVIQTTPVVDPAELLRAQCAQLLDMTLAVASDLPLPCHQALRARFANQVFLPADLAGAVNEQRQLVSALRSPVSGNGAPAQLNPGVAAGSANQWTPVTAGRMWTDLDRLQLAVERDLLGRALPAGSPDVAPLRGLRELYMLTTGDFEMTGEFHPERVQLAAVTTSTMAGLVKNAINKMIVDRWSQINQTGYLWWQDLVTEMDFASVQQVDWVNVGGIANLPTVAETETYDELAWADQTQTNDWVTKGGILTLSWQTIDRDGTGKLRQIPQLLAMAGARTLSALVAAIFTDNSGTGPTLGFDSGALFQNNSNRGTNLVTTALSYDAWITAQQTMFKQTEINSAKRLGIRPRFLLVPIEKYEAAYAIADSLQKPDSANYHANSSMLRAADIRTVPEWTDAYRWAAVADPMIYPCIGLGYRFGRVPQVVEEVPNTGGNFTNRTLRFRVDFVVNVGVIDYRGLFKSNASS